jgi:hypothetical protein
MKTLSIARLVIVVYPSFLIILISGFKIVSRLYPGKTIIHNKAKAIVIREIFIENIIKTKYKIIIKN